MWLRCVFGLSLRAAMSSIIRRRTRLTVLVSLMGNSILSEVDNTSISGRGSQTRQRFPLSWLPVSRLLPPRSGLERSDFVLWPVAYLRFDPDLARSGRYSLASPRQSATIYLYSGRSNDPRELILFVGA